MRKKKWKERKKETNKQTNKTIFKDQKTFFPWKEEEQ